MRTKVWCVCVAIAAWTLGCQSGPKASPESSGQRTVRQGNQGAQAGPVEVARAWAAAGMQTDGLAVDPGVKAQVEGWAKSQQAGATMQVIRAWEAGRGEWTVILGPRAEPGQGEQVMQVGVALVGGRWTVTAAKVSEATVGWPEL